MLLPSRVNSTNTVDPAVTQPVRAANLYLNLDSVPIVAASGMTATLDDTELNINRYVSCFLASSEDVKVGPLNTLNLT